MKSKIIISAALIALLSLGCNKASEQSEDQSQSDQEQQQSETNQGVAVGEPNAQQSTQPAPSQPSPTKVELESRFSDGSEVVATPTPEVIAVQITSTGFSPASVTIQKGDYIQFTNKDSASHWPASDPHPAHGGYPGFDANRPLKTGEIYRFQFEKTGSWAYHDHQGPSLRGVIIVK